MIIPIYKEKGPTSRQILNKIQKKYNLKKVGHAGTLDPLAEGVLVVGIGRESTKKLHTKDLDEKEYLAEIFLGEKSLTDDSEGNKEKVSVAKIPTKKEIEDALFSFQGFFMQKPPIFSAVKVKGKEAYKIARKGGLVKLNYKKVQVKSIFLMDYKYPFLKVKIITGGGFYVRSLARDLGNYLKTGAYLYSLKRTRVGDFQIKDCVKIENIYNEIS